MDWFPTYLAALLGAPDIKERLKAGNVRAIGRSYKVHLDGYNILPLLTGETEDEPPPGGVLLLRRWRPDGASFRRLENDVHGAEGQNHHARLDRAVHAAAGYRSCSTSGATPTSEPISPPIPTTTGCWTGYSCSSAPRQPTAQFLQTFQEFPPRQKAASFTIDQVMEQMERAMMEAQQRR